MKKKFAGNTSASLSPFALKWFSGTAPSEIAGHLKKKIVTINH